jgi:hypothetical protein
LIEKELNWKYKYSLAEGLKITYEWIEEQVQLEINETKSNKGFK